MKKLSHVFTAVVLALVLVSASSCKKNHCVTYYPNGNVKADWYAFDCTMPDAGATYYPDNGGGYDPNYCPTCTTGTDPHDPTIDYSVFHDGFYNFVLDDPRFVNGPHPDLNSRLILPDVDQIEGIDYESGGVCNHYITVFGWAGGYRARAVVDQNSFLASGVYYNVVNGDELVGGATYSNMPYGYAGNPATYHSKTIPGTNQRYYLLLE